MWKRLPVLDDAAHVKPSGMKSVLRLHHQHAPRLSAVKIAGAARALTMVRNGCLSLADADKQALEEKGPDD